MTHSTFLACLAASVAVGLAQAEQCSGLSCEATLSRSLLQAQGAKNGGPTKWADEAYQVAECDPQGAYDRVMSVPEKARKAAFENIKTFYEKLELGKWADAAYQLRGSQEDYDKVKSEGCTRSPKAIYEDGQEGSI
eukprot:TRINITY_DN1423_c0_g1_i4.p1 TRINITY_DN1423_c0_g1~~TRINITY_DN1423_c0_g1_i4.p1  ORF type:complete len:136 (-),score=27.95 TRINITY_DN1423_c0_g1_i4:356-763(-)